SNGGIVGQYLVLILRPLIGYAGCIIFALAMVAGTVYLIAAGKLPFAGRLTKLAFISIPIILAAWESGMHMRRFYWDQEARQATGYIGLWLGRFLRLLVGENAALPVALTLIVVLPFILLRLSPKRILKSIWVGIINTFRQQEPAPSRIIAPPQDPIEVGIEINGLMDNEGMEPAAPVEPTRKKAPVKAETYKVGEQVDLGFDELPALPKPKNYKLPTLKMLAPAAPPVMDENYRDFAADRIVKTLEMFGIPCHVTDVVTGPAVTRVEVVLGEGIRVKQVEGMEKDIAYNLPAIRVRVEAPIPGKTAVGIEFPNIKTNIVRLSEIIQTDMWAKSKAPLTIALAKNLNNQPVLANISKMPHLLVAGQTGSGKSVCLHAIIMSLLFRLTPDQLKLILIDPKMVEFGSYEGLPHLLTPVVNDVNDAVNALRWSVQEMRDRYKKLKNARAKNIQAFNYHADAEDRMPYIVIIIDEMADLMAQEGYEIESCITSLTQLARAVGIHLVLATQRPSVKIITGNIKANIPARVALNVASYTDSRTILDYKGAETLLGNGDMLYKAIDSDSPTRAQGVYIDDDEVNRVVHFLSKQGEPEFDDEVTADHAPSKGGSRSSLPGELNDDETGDIHKALMACMNDGEASVSMIQTKLNMGYPKARRIMFRMEELGLVGPKNGSKPRELIYSACRELLSSSREKDDISPVSDNINNVDDILAEV
ncbi:MAG: DNA translocase FtsK, partial [bacterium]|nr:DNA translocase FtsK [bacterium]